ncbi:5-methylthioadenosine/S-adenosylhomocysteine deaminase [Tamilnaduibacter salinus]|uniref:5-methylthioadenosine/S-adenosylhomocysteine deaminase n=1 Tax=Tamilnaduibacter salinus TaxID=1484056 RepID=A0A2U1CVE7_9GAMM|nr:TRZ/ATZ family hydrolase [Tamilnaduibacter salinus]PVY75482.1 5-methylthioadenosine/S-adenosylhomocysteine deaminase [Tamilnaduibacter salinus]
MAADTIIAVDTRINARWVIPVVPEHQVLEHHALLILGDRIEAIVPQSEADRHYRARETLNLGDHVLLPGLVNAHGHAAMSLFRGLADDLPLMTWLQEHIWPAEGAFISADFIGDGTTLAMAEMLRTGTTCFSDMYFFPEVVAESARDTGMRAQVCVPVIDFPTPWGSGPEEYLRKGDDLIRRWPDDDYIRVALGPHAPYTVSDGPLQDIARLSESRNVPVQVHLHETAGEIRDALEQTGVRPSERLASFGLLTDTTQCVHMTQVDKTDLALLERTGAHVIHCPESNLKLASGFCPVHQLQSQDINVAIGTDGAASNNDHDLFGELSSAAMLAKAVSGNAAALSAHQALAMGTINGARALGRDHEIGSLEVGKQADVIAVDLGDPFAQPVYDPASHLIYSLHARQLSHSWIGGIPQVQDGRLTRIDMNDLMLRVRDWSDRIRQHRNNT